MKIKHLLILATSALFAITGCNKPEDLGPERVEISQTTPIEFTIDGGSATIELVATVDWKLLNFKEDWLAVDPKSGKASSKTQTITVTALPNEGKARSAELTFGDPLTYSSITVNQASAIAEVQPQGTGTKEDPYNVKAVIEKYEKDGTSDEKIFVKGILVGFEGAFPAKYSSADIYIADTQGGDQLYIYHCKGLGGAEFANADDLKVGDELIINGRIAEYNGKVQIGAPQLYSLNGKVNENGISGGNEGGDDDVVGTPSGSGTEADPYNVAAAKTEAKKLGENDKLENIYTKGIVSSIKSIDTGSFGNAEYSISDDGNTEGEFIVYRGYYLGGNKFTSADQLKVGDEVIVVGTLVNYKATTPEYTLGSKIVSLNGSTDAGDDPGEGDEGDPDDAVMPEGSVTLTFPDGNQQSVSSYTDTWIAKVGTSRFSIANYNNNKNDWAFIKCGRKSDPSVASITNLGKMPKLSSVVVTVDKILDASKVNKAVLNVYSDTAKTSAVATDIQAKEGIVEGTQTYDIPADVIAEGLYYELVYDCEKHGNNNGIIQVSKIVYTVAE